MQKTKNFFVNYYGAWERERISSDDKKMGSVLFNTKNTTNC